MMHTDLATAQTPDGAPFSSKPVHRGAASGLSGNKQVQPSCRMVSDRKSTPFINFPVVTFATWREEVLL